MYLLIGQDIGVTSLAWDACSLWLLGYPEQALRRSQTALALAQELKHPFTLAYAQAGAGAYFHRLRREDQPAREYAEVVMRLAAEKGFGLILAIYQDLVEAGELLIASQSGHPSVASQ